MPRLSEASRNQAIGMLVAGVAKREVAMRLNCHTSTISRFLRRYQHTGDVKDMPKSDRPRTTTRRQDVNSRVTHLRDRFTPVSDTARLVVLMSMLLSCLYKNLMTFINLKAILIFFSLLPR